MIISYYINAIIQYMDPTCRNLHDLQEVSCDNKIYLIFIICSSTLICYFSGKMSNIIEGEAPESDDEDMFLQAFNNPTTL